MNWGLIVPSVCIPLMTSYVEQFFMVLFISLHLFQGAVRLDFLTILKLGCLPYWVVTVLYIFRVQIFHQIGGLQTLSPSLACVFVFLMVPSETRVLMKSEIRRIS